MTAADCRNVATLVRTLAAVEQLRLSSRNMTGEELLDDLRDLTDYVDPIECMALAAVCEVEAVCRESGLVTVPDLRTIVRRS